MSEHELRRLIEEDVDIRLWVFATGNLRITRRAEGKEGHG